MNITRKLGIWGVNGGQNPDLEKMLSFAESLTVISLYMSANGVAEFRRRKPDGILVVRFLHPKNWHENIEESARNYAAELLEQLPGVDALGAYWYFANEMNLYYENGWGLDRQWECETPEFYERLARWTRLVAEMVKAVRPETKMIMYPFASGHKEDGAWDNGEKKDGFAGYDYFADMIPELFGNIICWHGYWGDSSGRIPSRLYDPELSTWYALRFRRVLDLFNNAYNNHNVKMIIDECGGMDTTNPAFPDDMIYFGGQALTTPQVIAVTPFLWADNFNSIGNSLNDWQYIPHLDNFVKTLADMPGWVADDVPAPDPDPQPPITPPEDVMLFNDFDPAVLNENLHYHAQDASGKITGSVARIIAADVAEKHWGNHNPIKKGDKYWRVKYAQLVPEAESENRININVSFLDENGAPYPAAKCWFAYPTERLYSENWVGVFDNGAGGNGDAFTYPSGSGQIAQGKNGFSPAMGSEELGGYIIGGLGFHSEVIAGFGLTGNRHIEYIVIFQLSRWGEDDSTPPPNPEPPIDPEPPTQGTGGWFCKLLKALESAFCK